MKALINRYVLGPLGLAYEIRKPQPLQGIIPGVEGQSNFQIDDKPGLYSEVHRVLSDSAVDQTPLAVPFRSSDAATCWDLRDVDLRSGWYMLEIEHSLQSIGSVLTIDVGAEQYLYLLLTSKPVCKRIVRFGCRVSRCLVHIDQPDCCLASVTFKPLTANFADQRMRQRLSNRGRYEQLDAPNINLLYSAYNRHVHDGIFERPYRSNAVEHRVDTTLFPACKRKMADTKLVLVRESEKVYSARSDDSIAEAMRFARQYGWQVESQRDDETSIEVLQRCSEAGVFVMPLVSHVDYRIDIFHQMLAEIDSENILIYADHDHVNEIGVYHSPVLKPEWNPDLLLNMNYIQLPWMVSARWALQVLEQGETESVDDSLDRVLLAAALGVHLNGSTSTVNQERIAPQFDNGKESVCGLVIETTGILPLTNSQVKRLPKVLASVHAPANHDHGSLFFNTEKWCHQVRNSLQLAGKQADVVENNDSSGHCILWNLPSDTPSVDIVIPTRDKVELLQTCIESVLKKTTYTNYRLLVVDNDSLELATSEYYRSMASDKRFNLLTYSGSFNYSAINNYAVEQSNADVIVLLNNDTEVISPVWLDEMIRQAIRPEIGCVGSKLYYSNGRIQHGGVILGITGVAGHAHRYSPGDAMGYRGRLSVSQNFSAVTAACLAVRRSVWLRAGGLDEEKLGVAWNDVDFCLKVQALGYRNLWTPRAELFHHEGLSRGADDTRSKIARVDAERQVMMERWNVGDLTDPAYHPLLTRDNESFTLSRSVG